MIGIETDSISMNQLRSGRLFRKQTEWLSFHLLDYSDCFFSMTMYSCLHRHALISGQRGTKNSLYNVADTCCTICIKLIVQCSGHLLYNKFLTDNHAANNAKARKCETIGIRNRLTDMYQKQLVLNTFCFAGYAE